MPDDSETAPSIVFERDEEFASLYANNVRFEPSVWDFKFVFGQLDQSKTPNVVEQHTAMAIPWIQAKLCAYFMVVNVVLHQNAMGYITVPSSVMPPRPDPADPTLDDEGRKVVKYLAWVFDQFFGDKPYIPPGVEDDAPPPKA